MSDLPSLATVAVGLLGSGTLGALANGWYRTKRHGRDVDLKAKALEAERETQRISTEAAFRDELWRQVSNLRDRLGAAEAKIEALQSEKVQLLTDLGAMRVANEALTQELRECRADCLAVREERDALRRLLNPDGASER
jgi:predicted  nucleic acid-binding Zn-ribbon protein